MDIPLHQVTIQIHLIYSVFARFADPPEMDSFLCNSFKNDLKIKLKLLA